MVPSPPRFAGEVIETYAEAGEMAAPGSPLCTIADLSTVKLRIYVNEKLLGKVKLNDAVSVGVDSHPGERFDGVITWISPVAEFTPKNVQTRDSRADLVYATQVTLKNPNGVFKIGMPADAYIEGLAQ
jgi:HlyD family secretion protein